MSRVQARRIVIPAVIALLLSLSVVSIAFAIDAVWNSSCNSGELCVYKHTMLVAPLAATTTGDTDYGAGADIYPNSDNDPINNSVSSTKNLKSANDVIWSTGAGPSGSSLCVNANQAAIQLASSLNDRFSAHVVAANDTCD